MKKIVIDARESGSSTGRYIDKLIEHLYKIKPDYDIEILTKTPRIDYIKTIAPTFKVTGCDIKEFTFSEQLKLLRQLKRINADLVHFGMTQQPVLYRSKVVTTIHDLTTVWENNPAKNFVIHRVKQLVYRWVIRRVGAKSSAIITPSDFVKNDVIKYTRQPSSKFFVTYEAGDSINSSIEPIKSLVNKPFIFHLGRPTPHKNLPRLIEAFELMKKDHPDLLLVLAGKKDANYQMLEDMVNKKDIKGVLFTGFISDGQLKWMYQNCLAYVLPSLSEGFGLSGVESMVEGAPLISSNATCMPEIYGDAAEYFNPLDINEMASIISKVIDDESLRNKMIKKGYDQASKYSWQRMAKQTLEVYEKALNS